LGIDFENVKLDSIVMMTCLLLKDVTVVIVVDWDHKVFLIVFGLSFDVFVEDWQLSVEEDDWSADVVVVEELNLLPLVEVNCCDIVLWDSMQKLA
jgi:ligand-binding sensor protein